MEGIQKKPRVERERQRPAVALLTLMLAAALMPQGTASATQELVPIVVFAADGLENALGEIQAEWERERGEGSLAISYGNSTELAQRIEQGASAELFLSADSEAMDYLSQRKLIRAKSRSDLLSDRLVFVTSREWPMKEELHATRDFPIARSLGRRGRVALAKPETTKGGKLGKAALESLGLWPAVMDRITETQDERSALQLVSQRGARVGIVYRSAALTDPAVVVLDTFPESSHPPIRYAIARTAPSQSAGAAAFLAYLRSPAARAIFGRRGFGVLD